MYAVHMDTRLNLPSVPFTKNLRLNDHTRRPTLEIRRLLSPKCLSESEDTGRIFETGPNQRVTFLWTTIKASIASPVTQ